MNTVIAAVIIGLLVFILIGLVLIGIRLSGQSTDSRQLETRLTKLEARVDNLPTHQDLTNLRTEINKVVENSAAISGQTQAIATMLRTIQEHLLENDR